MRNSMLVLLLGASSLVPVLDTALAGPYGSDPVVVPGIGAPVGAAAYGRPPVTAYAPSRPRPNYGGGLLEFMMTGNASPAPVQTAYAPVPIGQPEPQAVASYEARPARAIDPIYQRQEVSFSGDQGPGTIVVDTTEKFLYLVEAPGRALRYGIGVGRPGFLWRGTKTITRKAEWPDWTPPAEMMLRRPDLPTHMAGGIANPLGARAMYLGSSLFRIHGTNEPDTIGTNVSSGCIRLTNEDVTDLFGRVHVGTRVIVM